MILQWKWMQMCPCKQAIRHPGLTHVHAYTHAHTHIYSIITCGTVKSSSSALKNMMSVMHYIFCEEDEQNMHDVWIQAIPFC